MTDERRAAIAGVFDRAAPTYDAVGVDFFSVSVPSWWPTLG